MPKKEKTKIEVYKSWCKRCGICVAFCPVNVLAQDETGTPYVKDPERCTACRLCELRCPDFAINLRPVGKKGARGGAKPAEDAEKENP
ncbi:MAG TPA: 4Fe-4S binding protein [Thermodesulfobacteriota bacterium]|nr:4Fe-4S binding protein [Thermodesulfobacteriota bacterium]